LLKKEKIYCTRAMAKNPGSRGTKVKKSRQQSAGRIEKKATPRYGRKREKYENGPVASRGVE